MNKISFISDLLCCTVSLCQKFFIHIEILWLRFYYCSGSLSMLVHILMCMFCLYRCKPCNKEIDKFSCISLLVQIGTSVNHMSAMVKWHTAKFDLAVNTKTSPPPPNKHPICTHFVFKAINVIEFKCKEISKTSAFKDACMNVMHAHHMFKSSCLCNSPHPSNQATLFAKKLWPQRVGLRWEGAAANLGGHIREGGHCWEWWLREGPLVWHHIGH